MRGQLFSGYVLFADEASSRQELNVCMVESKFDVQAKGTFPLSVQVDSAECGGGGIHLRGSISKVFDK